jgi:hypothetical protein
MGCIGETADVNDAICGAVVNIRNKGDRLCLWVRDFEAKNDIEALMYERKIAFFFKTILFKAQKMFFF